MVRTSGLSWKEVPRFVKVVLALQAGVIVGLSVWMYKEYSSNAYLQTYLFSLFQGRGSIIAVLGLGGLLGTALVGILLKAGNILGEIENLSEKVQHQTGVTQARTETPMIMPVLKVVVAEPVDEIGRLHRSLQRWNEKSKQHQ
jgi:hypothetical protein